MGSPFYPDWPAPTMYDALVSAVQELITEKKSPAEFLDEISKPYDDYRAQIGK